MHGSVSKPSSGTFCVTHSSCWSFLRGKDGFVIVPGPTISGYVSILFHFCFAFVLLCFHVDWRGATALKPSSPLRSNSKGSSGLLEDGRPSKRRRKQRFLKLCLFINPSYRTRYEQGMRILIQHRVRVCFGEGSEIQFFKKKKTENTLILLYIPFFPQQ